MHKLRQIFAFVAPYVKPYWGRSVAGVFFGILFGVSNGLALWTTKIMLDRLVPANESLAPASATAVPDSNWFAENTAAVQSNILKTLDPWLPQMGDPLTYLQIIGWLLIFPLLVGFRGTTKYLACLLYTSDAADE